jgi:hypothetical protein
MARDTHIPLVFWIAAAALAHVLWAGGTDRVINVLERRMQLFEFLVRVDAQAEAANRPMEVTLEATPPAPEPEVTPPPPEPRVAVRPPKPKPPAEPPRPRPTPPKPTKPREKPAPELAILVPPKPAPAKPKPPEPPDEQKRRISVRQHVQDKNQKPNPDAEFLGKYANRVKEQTQARITSTDRDDPNPTPGSSHTGPIEFPGNSDQTRVAQSEDKAGTPNLAPDLEPAPTREARHAETATAASESARPRAQSKPAAQPEPARPPTPEQQAQAAASRTVTSDQGSYALGADRSQRRREAVKGRLRQRRQRRADPLDMLGLGSMGTTSRGINLNLTPQAAVAAVGEDALARERKRDRERRLSEHRGSWKSVGLERWRSAIENYVPSVKLGNQTALNTAAAPFAEYLNQIHNRIHPIFADTFLASLDSLPRDHPMNDPELKTSLELVLSQTDGHLVRMGVTHTSGVTAYDIGALESVQRASPFGSPPPEIVSPDGNVYLHWEFHRQPWYACSTYFARPYILKGRPENAPSNIKPSPDFDNKERPPSEPRRGRLSPTAAPRWAALLSNPSR